MRSCAACEHVGANSLVLFGLTVTDYQLLALLMRGVRVSVLLQFVQLYDCLPFVGYGHCCVPVVAVW